MAPTTAVPVDTIIEPPEHEPIPVGPITEPPEWRPEQSPSPGEPEWPTVAPPTQPEHLRFDVDLLADRLVGAVEQVQPEPPLAGLGLGLFGASTGAGAALVAAARLGDRVRAVVSRGGRPDLAGPSLAEVLAPTLLIVGSRDPVVLDLNQQAAGALRCLHRLEVVHGATHLFEEPGALAHLASLAADWFTTHLVSSPVNPRGASR